MAEASDRSVPAEVDRGWRVDPFLLPHRSTARLVLLGLTLIAASSFAVYWVLVLDQDRWRDREVSCVVDLARWSPDPATAVAGFDDCLSAVVRDQAWLTLCGPLVLAVAATVGWLAAPAVVAWWHQVRPVRDELGVRPALDELAREAGLATWQRPEFVVAHRHDDADAWTFGRRGRYRIALGVRLLPLHDSHPAVFKATIRHELGHVRNRDVDRTYLALCAWYAYLFATAVELVYALSTADNRQAGVVVSLRLSGVAVVVYLALVGFLRAREFDADLRAAANDSGRRDLTAALAPRAAATWSAVTTTDSDGRFGQSARVGSLWGFTRSWANAVGRIPPALRRHPPAWRRELMVGAPERGMTLSIGEAAGVGVAAGLTYVEVERVADGLLSGNLLLSSWIAGVVVGVPVMGVVGVAAWRYCLARQAARRDTARGLPVFVGPGIALGGGLVLGNELSPRAAATWTDVISTSSSWLDATTLTTADRGRAAVLVPLTVAGSVAAVGWVVGAARGWCTGREDRRPGPVLATHVAVGALALAVPFAYWFMAVAALSSGTAVSALDTWYKKPVPRGAATVGLTLALAYLGVGWLRSTEFGPAATLTRSLKSRKPPTAATGLLVCLTAVPVLVVTTAALALPVSFSRDRAESTTSVSDLEQTVPHTSQGFFACIWATHDNWAPLVAAKTNAGARRFVGDYLTGTDDPAMRVIGAAYTSSTDHSEQVVTAAASALMWLCDLERRYGRASTLPRAD